MKFRDFANCVTIITGAASGLGRAMSKLLVESGSRVILIDKNREALTQAMEGLKQKAEAKVADVTDFSAIKNIVSETVRKYGKLDYFFNNASVAVMGEARDIAIEDWNKIIDIDLKGTVNGVLAAYPVMIEQKSGHIVNISSIAGITPAVMLVPYAAAKYGIVGLSHSLRMEARELGVKVSVACPNFINTPIWTNTQVVGSTLKTPKDFLKIFRPSPKLLDADIAAKIILKGVLKNKMTILNDFQSRLLWWNYRFTPSFWMWLNDVYIMKKFRALRK
jgi:NADP-dependent 3-hydroxy acid dehydrogenase YdfG